MWRRRDACVGDHCVFNLNAYSQRSFYIDDHQYGKVSFDTIRPARYNISENNDMLSAPSINSLVSQDLLLFLDRHERTVSQITEVMPLGQPTTSEHLAVMKPAGVPVYEKCAKRFTIVPTG